MAENSKIEWTVLNAFNPWIGCTEVSPACANCYARELSKRRGWAQWGKLQPRYRTSLSNWKEPFKWNRAAEKEGERKRVFCASLADIFDSEVPHEWRHDLYDVIERTPSLDWLLLTKRIESAVLMLPAEWLRKSLPNVWMGTTVESPNYTWRIDDLRELPAAVRFLSCEPLLADLGKVDLSGIHWVIAGGESGHGARPMHPAWTQSLRDQSVAASVPFFFKQWGNWALRDANNGDIPFERCKIYTGEDADTVTLCPVGKKRAGRLLDGRTWDEMPESKS